MLFGAFLSFHGGEDDSSVILALVPMTPTSEATTNITTTTQLIETSIRLYKQNHVNHVKRLSLRHGDVVIFTNEKKLKTKNGFYITSGLAEEGSPISLACRLSLNRAADENLKLNAIITANRVESEVLSFCKLFDEGNDVEALLRENMIESRGRHLDGGVKRLRDMIGVGDMGGVDAGRLTHIHCYVDSFDRNICNNVMTAKTKKTESIGFVEYMFVMLKDRGGGVNLTNSVLLIYLVKDYENVEKVLGEALKKGEPIVIKNVVAKSLSATASRGQRGKPTLAELMNIHVEGGGLYLEPSKTTRMVIEDVDGEEGGNEEEESSILEEGEGGNKNFDCGDSSGGDDLCVIVGWITTIINGNSNVVIVDNDVNSFVERGGEGYIPLKIIVNVNNDNVQLTLDSEMVGKLFLDVTVMQIVRDEQYKLIFQRIVNQMVKQGEIAKWKIQYDQRTFAVKGVDLML